MPLLPRGILILLCLAFGSASAGEPTPGPVEGPTQAAVRPVLVGVLAATRAVDLLPQVEGRLEQLKVRLGDRVEAGQVVALLDTRMRQLELASRQAAQKASEAEQARFALLLQQAQRQLEREQRIREHTAAEVVEKAEHEVALAASDVELAKAKLAESQVQVSLALEALEQARIRAPFTGVVSEEYLQPGMMASRTTPILRLVSEERLLRFAIPEALVSSVRVGDAVRVQLEGASPIHGVVERLSPELDATSRHLKAEALLNLPPEVRARLPIGTLVPVELAGPAATHASGKHP